MIRARTMLVAVAVVTSSLLIACSDNTSNKAPDNSSDNPQLFGIPAEQMSHVQIVTVQPTTIERKLRLTGTVAFNGFDTTPVITQVGGPVSRIVVSPGQIVHKGQPLLYVTSPDFSQLRASYLKAKDAFELAEKNYKRAEDLYNHHAIAARDLEAAASAKNQAQADLQANEQALRILGFQDPNAQAPNALKGELPLLAPIGGEVVERLVAAAQVIQAGATQAFTISNTSTVWVLANVYQQDLPYVRVGDPVTISTDAYPDQEFHGKISYVAAALDATTRMLQARIDVKNPQDRLKKDMYVVAGVLAGKIPDVLTVPKGAVLHDSENEPFVYVVAANNQFSRRQVKVGEATEDQFQITSGLTAGEKVAGDGSVFLQFANSSQK